MNKKNIIFIISLLILLLILNINNIILFYNIYKVIDHKDNIREIVKTDTTIIVDTITKWYPKPVDVKVRDTIYIHSDSIKQDGDSILLPKEEKVYTDDSTYNVRISGFQPILEEITVYPKTYTIENTKTVTVTKKDHWNYGIGVGAGYGLFNRKFDIYAGFTVGYSF